MFTDTLEIGVELKTKKGTLKVPGGQVKHLSLSMTPSGFTGEIGLWVSSETSEDTFFAPFVGPDLMKIHLGIVAGLVTDDDVSEPVLLEGLVTEKILGREFVSQNVTVQDDAVLYRYYHMTFADAGKVLWKQHYPAELLVDGSLKDLLSRNAAGVPLKLDWEPLSAEHPVNVLPGYTHRRCASFHDMLVWIAETHGGMFLFDYEKLEYAFVGEKKSDGEVMEFHKKELGDLRTFFPETSRANDCFHNAFCDAPVTKVSAYPEAEKGIRKTRIVNIPVSSDFDACFTAATRGERGVGEILHMTHARFPLKRFHPGVLFSLHEAYWSDKLFASSGNWRVVTLEIRADTDKDQPDAGRNFESETYNISMKTIAELADSESLSNPSHVPPHFPILVDGKIVSEQGGEKEKTFQIYEHAETKLDCLHVKIPVFGDQVVPVSHEPLFATGHFYFPPFKDQKAEIALGFHDARITRFLDFRPGGSLPMESQGNHLLLGKDDEKDNTSISHIYVDGKPQLNIRRKSGKDLANIEIQEGSIVIEAREEE